MFLDGPYLFRLNADSVKCRITSNYFLHFLPAEVLKGLLDEVTLQLYFLQDASLITTHLPPNLTRHERATFLIELAAVPTRAFRAPSSRLRYLKLLV